MAEERKPRSGAARMFGKTPRIGDGEEPRAPQREAPGGAAGGGAAAEPVEPAPNPATDTGPEADVMAGTEGIPTHHHQHAQERTEMHHRHMHEHHAMHERHEREHLMRVMGHHHESMRDMHDRHEEERRKMHTQHERERREMHERHEEQMRSTERGSRSGGGPTGGMREKEEGKGGTEPKK